MRWTVALLLVGCSRPWVAPAELPTPRHGHRSERIGDALYVVGGSSAGNASSEVWCYDGEWRACAPAPGLFNFFGSAAVDGDLVIVGSSVARYHPPRDTWEVLLAEGAPRSHFGAAAVDGVLYTLGGFPELATGFHAFDLEARTWAALTAPPDFAHGDHFHILVELGGELHVIGGLVDSDPAPTHWVLREGKWARLPDLPAAVWAKFAVWQVVEGELVLFSTSEDVGLRYDGVWTELTPAPVMVAMATAVVADGKLRVLGGMFPGERRRLVYDLAADRWE